MSLSRRSALALGCAALIGGAVLVAVDTASAASVSMDTASAAGTGFTAGDVVVYRVGDGSATLSSAAAPVFLDEYAPDGTLVESVPLPTTAGGGNNPLVASGSATSEGLLTLSADGRYLIAPGYDAAAGTTKISSSTGPRTVARVGADGTVDTTTALTDFAIGNNPRSATSSDGTSIWVGGAAGGARYTTIGATTSTELDSGTFKNVREVAVTDGQLYASADPTKAGLTIGTVGTGLPTTTGQAVTNLPFGTLPGDPYGYSLLTLGSQQGAPDTLYEADLTAGAVVKYGLVNGSWVQEGSVLVAQAEGLTANDANGTVTIYVTSSGASGTAGTISRITDATGVGGTLSGSATTIATLPAGEAARGVAFAPGTVIGTGGGVKPPVVLPTITTPRGGLPAALGDANNETLPITVADTAFPADQLTVTATSSNPADVPTISGSGTDRTLSVTPGGGVGLATITLTVTAPDATSATKQISYGVSAAVAGSPNYFSGSANASAAIDVGDGYALVGDDENSVLRLYDLSHSGAPVNAFDFSAQLPLGGEIDIEAAARVGDLIYWEGSMSTTSSGNQAPSRSTVFSTRISGSGASTTLTYVGAYTGLLSDLIAWDQGNGNVLGLAASAAPGVGGHDADALNVEGLEFAAGSSETAYLGFRAPLEPTTDRHLAMLVPVTNYGDLPGGSVHATFGSPIYFDLGGLGIRDIKANADGQYLIIAGTADDANSGFVLYSWDGVPGHAPRPTGTTLPQLPTADDLGAWETIVATPDPLVAGAPLQLIQDDGDVDYYGDGLTSKTGTVLDLQKDLGLTFSYAPPAPDATTVAVTSSANPATPGQAVTLTATVSGPSDEATPVGSVTFSVTGADGSHVDCTGGDAVALSSGTAACMLPSGGLRASGSAYTVKVVYGGDSDDATGSTTAQEIVTGTSTTTVAAPIVLLPLAGKAIPVLAVVAPSKLTHGFATGTVTMTVTNASGSAVYTMHTALPLIPLVAFTIPGSVLTVGHYTVTVAYSGDEYYSPSHATFSVAINR